MMQQVTDKCDLESGCKGGHGDAKVEGVLFFATGATGRICPVLFLCRAEAGEENFTNASDSPPENAFVFVPPW